MLLCTSILVQAQSVFSDSLRAALRSLPNDSNKVKKLLTAQPYLAFTQPDSAIFYADSIIHFSEGIKFDYGKARGYQLKANAYLYNTDYLLSLYYSQKALHLFESLNERWGIAHSHTLRGTLFTNLGDFKQARAEMLRSRKIIYSLGSEYYDRQNDTIVSSELEKLSIDYELATVYLASNMLDSALVLAKAVLKLDQDLEDNWSAPPILLGDIYYKRGEYDSALQVYNTRTTLNFGLDSAKNFIGRALVFAKLHQADSSIMYARRAFEISERIKLSKEAMQASEILSKAYENIDSEKSIKYYKINTALKDSLYNREKVNQFSNIVFSDELRRLDAKAAEESARNKFRIWSLLGITFTLVVTGLLLWRNNQHKKTANKLLQQEKQTVEKTLQRLQSTQSQLIHSEKMASLGELTAGIAHEIQNPLNFVNNFSEVNRELLIEMKEEIEKGNIEEVKTIATTILENHEKINHHGKRADGIVKGMLQHSRSSSGIKEPTDLNVLADEYLRLAFHGFRAKDKTFNVTTKTDFDKTVGKVNVVPQDIGRVVLNLITNAFYTVSEKKNQTADEYEPTVTVKTIRHNGRVLISVKDNGIGIPQKVLDKIFQPFFTTKPTGQGTGLGLSLSYDIIKAHGGEINVETNEGVGTEFKIHLPVH